MKRYVIVCLIKGEAQRFHEKLVIDVCYKFKVKPQRIPMHITLKAPFEIGDISEIEKVTKEFAEKSKSCSIKIKDYGCFRENVIFMDVEPSYEAVEVHDKYMDVLKNVPNLEWSRNEGKGRKFHCTVVSKKIEKNFKDIWEYVNEHKAEFDTAFDNISIMEYNKILYKWELYKSFELNDSRE